MKIAGDFRSQDWPGLRKRLEIGDAAAWSKATDLLRSRIGGRYLGHARQIVDSPNSGFAVLAIDSAIIEALEQFRRGVRETPWKKGGEYFRTFLTTSRLKRFFSTATADLFYTTIRCGILHQAETRADSRVKRKPSSFVVRSSRSGKGIVINARRFHDELEAAFEDYVAAILGGDDDLRAAFIKKMNFIAKSEPSKVNAGLV